MFAHVLNYLRYGSITLPNTVPKDMFLRELDFYGINTAEGTVKTYCEGWADRVTKRHKSIKKMERDKKELMLENDIECLAHYCANQLLNGMINLSGISGSGSICLSRSGADEETKKLWQTTNTLHNSRNKELFQSSLSKFGLTLQEVTSKFGLTSEHQTFYLTLKTL